jgi:23S rRNA maturation-related 3'-5' exoribonuclease YhaM
MADSPFHFTTKLWQRSQNSYATTIPKEVLAIRGVTTDNAQVEWHINQETGSLEVEFTQVGENDG